jgi:hypothetical protein
MFKDGINYEAAIAPNQPVPKEHHEYEDVKGKFDIYARLGRWGTCADCPQDGNHRTLPELCKNTERHDHFLSLKDLVDWYTGIVVDAQKLANDRSAKLSKTKD